MNIIANIVLGNKSRIGRKVYLEGLSLILIFAIAFTPLKPIALIAATTLWALYLPYVERMRSLILRLVLSLCLTAAFIQVSGIVLWQLGVAYSVPVAVALQLAVIVPFIIKRTKSLKSRVVLMEHTDLVALAVSVVTILILAFGVVQRPLLPNLLRYSTNAFDDTIHTSLSISVYNQSGYVYGHGDQVINRVVYRALVAYPQGWYLTNSVWWHAFNNQLSIQNSPETFLLFYFLTKLLWYGLTVFLFIRLVLYLAQRLLGRLGIVEYVAASALAFLVQGLMLLGIYKFGFSSFLPQLVFSLALTFFLTEITSEVKDNTFAQWNILYALLLCGGISFSWLLAAPAAYASVFIGIIVWQQSSLKKVFVWAQSHWLVALAGLLVTALGSTQFLIQVFFSENKNLINTDGGIWPINLLAFALLLILTLTYFTGKLPIRSHLQKVFLLSFCPSAILAGLVYIYQFLAAGKATYYSTKLAYMPYLMVLVFGCVALVALTSTLSKQQGKLLSILTVCSLVLITPFILGTDLQLANYATGKSRKLSPYSASQLAGLMGQKAIFKDNFVMFKDLDYEEDIITTNYVGMLSRTQSSCQSEITWQQITKQHSVLISTIKKCAETSKADKFYVFASSKDIEELSKSFRDISKIELILTN